MIYLLDKLATDGLLKEYGQLEEEFLPQEEEEENALDYPSPLVPIDSSRKKLLFYLISIDLIILIRTMYDKFGLW